MGRNWRPSVVIAAAAALGGALGFGAPAAVGAPDAAAAGTTLVFPIPGLGGRTLTVGGVARLNDGGALIASSTRASARARWQLTATRLLVDGTVDLAYGSAGNVTAGRGRATAVAIDPRNGASWLGAATASGHGEIVALDPRGARRRKFGSGGVLRLASPPAALAWRHGTLIVATGTRPCRGCDVQALDPSSGAVRAAGELGTAPPGPTATARCVPRAVTSLAAGAGGLMAATLGTPACPAQVVSLHVRGGSLSAGATVGLPGATGALLSAAGGQACVGAVSPGHAWVGPPPSAAALGSSSAGPPARIVPVPAGRLVALVPLGDGACAALIAPRHGSRALVAQAVAGARHATVDRLPRGLRPLGMSRCEQHLLVIGAHAAGHRVAGRVAVVPVRAGPYSGSRTRSALAAAARCGSVPSGYASASP